MAGTRRYVAAALAAAAVALSPPLRADALRTLQVDALSMRADRSRVGVGEVFHLAIHVRVREHVPELDELVIPDVGTMQILGDERHVTSSPEGTDVVETLTVEPRQPGTFTFNGAYLDAIDARTHKPSRFSANPVRVVVTGGGNAFVVFHPGNLVWIIAGIILASMGVLVAVGLVIVLVRMPRRPPPIVAPPSAPAAPPPRTVHDAVADALRAYRTAPSHDALMRLRAALFGTAGVSAGATLRDALAATSDRGLHAALIAAERTAFGPAHARDAASVELIGATEAWLQ